MRDLTEQQERFVLAFTSEPGCIGNATRSALHAGYSEKSARDLGHQLLDKPHVRAAIEEAQRRQISGPLAAKAVEVLERILDDPDAAPKLKLEAAKTVLDRAGIIAPRAPEHEAVSALTPRKRLADMSLEELEAERDHLLAMAARSGLETARPAGRA